MRKTQRMKANAERAKKEDLANTAEIVKEAGLNYEDHELPPDEVDEKEVAKTMWQSFRTFIPGTEEYYEAKAAEEEMDDLKKIRIEKVKATDLYNKTKNGKHEEALDEMMAETNNDFFFFNKMKYKMEQEGTWSYDFEKREDALATMGRSTKRNRLRKAANAVYGALDEDVTKELARMSSISAGQKTYDKSAPCNWRGKNKEGEPLRCENSRMEKPPREGSPARRKNEPPEVLACCAYHTPFCVSDAHEEDAKVKIKVPNMLSLCAECYMIAKGKKPPPLTAVIVPGVIPTALARSKISLEGGKKKAAADDGNDGDSVVSASKQKKNAMLCSWVANPDDPKTRGYECSNNKFYDAATKQTHPTCPWHSLTCFRSHPVGTSAVITIPNEFGLCAMHHLAEKGCPPEQHPFPLPGMVVKVGKDDWKRQRHFATPKEPPPPIIEGIDYYERPKAGDLLEKAIRGVQLIIFYWNRRKKGLRMAKRIQRWYRGSLRRRIHTNIGYMRARYPRLLAAVKIQALVRRRLGTNRVRRIRQLFNDSARCVQRHWRGWWRRLQLRIDWAARRLVKFMRLLHFFKFKDTVIMVMQLRRLFKLRNKLAVKLQRMVRGHLARRFVFRKRLWIVVARSYSRKIIRSYRAHQQRLREIPWSAPGEDWVLSQVQRKLALMIAEMYQDRERRKQLAVMMHRSAPPIQRVIRGFLARAGTKKMGFLRKAMRSWLALRLAQDFMEDFLNSKIFYLKPKKLSEEEQAMQVDKFEAGVKHIRAHLPEDLQDDFEIDHRVFDHAIEEWYRSENQILLHSEKHAIFLKFRNPMNGAIKIKALDEFITLHKIPCRKHGRYICGDCVFRRHCQISGCQCTIFHSSTDDGHGICVTCNHPGSLHSLCPSQCRAKPHKNAIGPSMIKVLTAHREPDMSFPMTVEGVAIDNVIIPEPSADDKREMHTIELQKEKLHEEFEQTHGTRSLAKHLALCERDGDTVEADKDYWDQHGLSAVLPIEHVEGDKQDTAIFDPVMFDSRRPDYDVSSSTFWSLTSKNPIKRVRDYNEKFDHNMPVPVVHEDEVVYTFEGPQIYFNLINQIIRLDESVHYDNPVFLKLVVDHIQIFERHWRKMVADIRKGKLDRNLVISEESRFIFESANIPRPPLAKRLDDTFRNLGFHKKVLGKDIQIRPYAKKKKSAFAGIKAPKRKNSLPGQTSQTPLASLSSANPRAIADARAAAVAAVEAAVATTTTTSSDGGETGTAADMAATAGTLKPQKGRYTASVKVQKTREAFSDDDEQLKDGSGPGATTTTSGTTAVAVSAASSFSPSASGKVRTVERTAAGRGLSITPEGGFPSKSAAKRAIREALGMSSPPASPSKSGKLGALTDTTSTAASSPSSPNGRSSISQGDAAARTPTSMKRSSGSSKREMLANLSHSFKGNSMGFDDGATTPNADGGIGGSGGIRPGSNMSSSGAGGAGGAGVRSLLSSRQGTADSMASTASSATAGTGTAAGDGMTTGRRTAGTPKRRGSFGDVEAKPMAAHDVNELHYGHDTAARESYRHTIKMDGDRFVCPFPACGKSFHSMEAAFRHLPVHEQRRRLAAPTPLPDSHLSFYWPQEVPWLTADQFVDREVPPGSLQCPVVGCKQVFPNQSSLDGHLKNFHRKVDRSSVRLGYFQMRGKPMFVPPDRPASCIPLRWCPLHALPLGSCPICVEIDARKGPKPPFRMHRAVSINFRTKRTKFKGQTNFMNADQEHGTVTFHQDEEHIGVVIVQHGGHHHHHPSGAVAAMGHHHPQVSHNDHHHHHGSTNHHHHHHSHAHRAPSNIHEWRGRPVAMMTDRFDLGWVAVEVLLTYHEALAQGMFIPHNFNKRNQLLRPLAAHVSVNDLGLVIPGVLEVLDDEAETEMYQYIRWVPIHMVDRTFPIEFTTQQNIASSSSSVVSSHGSMKHKMLVAITELADRKNAEKLL